VAEQFPELTEKHTAFIDKQAIFFVATALEEGRINLSPKGMDSLKVLAPKRIAWLNMTGSGNETAGHIQENERMTIMWCSFEKAPLILRVYGTAKVLHTHDKEWNQYSSLWNEQHGKRQIFIVDIDTVQTSCGYAVPLMELQGERDTLRKWSDAKGDEGITNYWKEKNQSTIDGTPTNIIPN
tara:strand:- start:639 stop:1184 length:546 start_codon:yes stop_codon:yes gene_type:complete